MPMPRTAAAATALILLAGLAGCGPKPGNSTDALDNELVNGIGADVDPALTTALGNQIVVDPARAGSARPTGSSATRETLGDRAKAQSAAGTPACDFKYDLAWAGKLPAVTPVYPGAKVVESAGSDAVGCRRRIVNFTTVDPAARVIAYYSARVAKAGFSVEHLTEKGSEILGGTKGDAAYYLSVTPAKGGSVVDLIAN